MVRLYPLPLAWTRISWWHATVMFAAPAPRAVAHVRLAAGCRPYAQKYADDQEAFFKDYAAAHKKLSENGASWVEGGPVSLD